MKTQITIHCDMGGDTAIEASTLRVAGTLIGSISIGDDVVVYVTADQAAKLAEAALLVCTQIDKANADHTCDLCGARLMSGNFCRDEIGCQSRAEAMGES